MRLPALPIIASFALLASPAFAQSSGTTGTMPEQSGVSSPSTNTTTDQSGVSGPSTNTTEQTGMSGPAATWQHNASVTADTRQKIAQSLEQSGFKDIRVTPEAFVIHAQAPDGSRVVMLLRPDQVTGVVEQTGSSSEPNGTTSEPYGSMPSGSSNGSMPSGSSNSEGGMSR